MPSFHGPGVYHHGDAGRGPPRRRLGAGTKITDNIMKLGIVLPYSGADMSLPIDRVLEAERLGFDSVWTSEAYGSDAVTPAAWVLARTTRIKVGTAIMQMPARTPAMTAMTAMT